MMDREQALAFFADKKNAYLQTFGTQPGALVLEDLAPFCRENATSIVRGERDATFAMEGRREVILRIRDFLSLTPDELLDKYTVMGAKRDG